MRRANYRILRSKPDRLLIDDIGPWDRHPTVTNDAEAVVSRLLAEGQLQPGQRLFYIDSEGRTDEILIRAGRFAGFAPGPGATLGHNGQSPAERDSLSAEDFPRYLPGPGPEDMP